MIEHLRGFIILPKSAHGGNNISTTSLPAQEDRRVQSQMTEVPDNRTSQMAEFKQIEEVYRIIVFF